MWEYSRSEIIGGVFVIRCGGVLVARCIHEENARRIVDACNAADRQADASGARQQPITDDDAPNE